MAVRPIPPWAVVSATAAPVLLGAGLALAQWRQPPGYDPVREHHQCAGRPRGDRPLDHDVGPRRAGRQPHGHGRRSAARPGRRPGGAGRGRRRHGAGGHLRPTGPWKLGGPHHRRHGGLRRSGPVAPCSPPPAGPPNLYSGPAPSAVAAAVLGALVLSFVAEIHGGHRGLAERAAAGGQALWPLAVVLTGRAAPASSSPM